jgi:Zn-finger nucleic acid-binding protein
MSDSDRVVPNTKAAATGMKCPVDHADLVMSERQGIEIDYCPRCRGVWLDRGELDKIIERSTASEAPQRGPGPQERPQPASQGDDSGSGGGHGGAVMAVASMAPAAAVAGGHGWARFSIEAPPGDAIRSGVRMTPAAISAGEWR